MRRTLTDVQNRTFVTRFDRDDMFLLLRNIAHVLDGADTKVELMVVLGINPIQYILRVVSFYSRLLRRLTLRLGG